MAVPSAVHEQQSCSVNRLEDASWFWADLGRDDVNEIIRNKPDGTFLVRNSTTPGDCTLTVRMDGCNRLIKIYRRNGHYSFSSECSQDVLSFASVVELVDHYRSNSLVEYNRNLDTMLLFPLSRMQADEDVAVLSVEVISNKIRQVHAEYLKKSVHYDELFDELSRSSHELQLKRQAAVAFLATLKLFDEQIELRSHARQADDALVTGAERQKLQKNLESLENRRAELLVKKKILDEDMKSELLRSRSLERELNIIKPDIVRLYRKREQLQRMMVRKGMTTLAVQKLLEQFTVEVKTMLFSSPRMHHYNNSQHNGVSKSSPDAVVEESYLDNNNSAASATSKAVSATSNESASTCNNRQQQLFVSYPHSDHTTWLTLNATRQSTMQHLTGRVDGTFLIRPSESIQGSFALSVVCNRQVYNCLIEQRNGQFGFANTDVLFPSLMEFVLHYAKNSLAEHNRDLTTKLLYPVNATGNCGQQQQYH